MGVFTLALVASGALAMPGKSTCPGGPGGLLGHDVPSNFRRRGSHHPHDGHPDGQARAVPRLVAPRPARRPPSRSRRALAYPVSTTHTISTAIMGVGPSVPQHLRRALGRGPRGRSGVDPDVPGVAFIGWFVTTVLQWFKPGDPREPRPLAALPNHLLPPRCSPGAAPAYGFSTRPSRWPDCHGL